ncbi:MAG TPA: MOSC domain-containing protein [Verrucomicrobiae bacterium]|nr:MOSC domain-containing protein [Verrucomicrobiae bacterium]
MEIGRIERIWRYPVKSLRPQPLAAANVMPEGLEGDRTRALLVRSGHAREGKTYRGKEHDRLHLTDRPQEAVALARERGVEAELAPSGRYFDDAPVSLIVDRWLETLQEHVGYPVEPLRFRPNFFVRAAAGFTLDEEAMTGWELALGAVRLRVRGPIERCVTTTYDPEGGPSDPRVLRFVAQERKTWMGIYCDVLEPGLASIGDVVTASLASRSSPASTSRPSLRTRTSK